MLDSRGFLPCKRESQEGLGLTLLRMNDVEVKLKDEMSEENEEEESSVIEGIMLAVLFTTRFGEARRYTEWKQQ